MTTRSKRPETLVLHAGPRNDETTGAVAVPIFQTTSYQFRSTEHAANLFALKDFGNIYSRIMNPTCDALEQKMAALEGGVAALAVSSGQAASAMALQNLCRPGDNVVSSTDLYGGTWNLFANTLPSMGINVRFVDPADPEAFRRATDGRTRAYYAETLPNPKLTVFPIGEVAATGRELGVPLIMDNTAAPVICRPLEHGAAIIVHSMTKYVGGHGTSIGGIIIDSGHFPWTQGHFPQLTEPSPGYHGIRFTETFGEMAYIIKVRVEGLRDLGPCMSPFNSFLFLQGVETLGMRMDRHSRNALAAAEFLEKHPLVTWVKYPALASSPYKPLADKYVPKGAGSIVTFGIKGGKEAGRRMIDSVQLFSHLANLGDAKSLIIHPASTTHQQLNDEQQFAAGITPDLVRLSVGIEDIDDILWDLDQALQASQVSAASA